MGKKLHVGNLPYSMTDQDLVVEFSKFGAVNSAAIERDPKTGRSRGFGSVEMANDADAQDSIDTLNFTEYEGLIIGVSEVRARK